MSKNLYSLAFLSVLLLACNANNTSEENDKSKETYDWATITHPMGTHSSVESVEYLVLPFNLGRLESELFELPIIILGKPISKNKVLQVEVFGYVLVSEKSVKQHYLLAQPLLSKTKLKIENFDQFAVQYSSIKSILSLYLNNQHGIGKSEVLKWGDEHEAKQLIHPIEVSNK